MTTQTVDLYQSVTDKMIAALESGVAPWHQPWTGGAKGAPKNAVSQKPYRGMNIWLLSLEKAARGYTSSDWLTFKQAMGLGGKFKGEKGDDIRKGTQVILWKPLIKGKTDASGRPVLGKNGKQQTNQFLYLRSFTVFNVGQFTDLKLRSEEASENSVEPIEAAEAIVSGYTRGPKVSFGFSHAAYFPGTDHIEMPSREQFKSGEDYYATLFHELNHSTLHESRLNRKDSEKAGSHAFGTPEYSQEELVAEMGSAMLAASAGIESTLDTSASYLASWIKVLKGDNRLVLAAAGKAQRSCDYILGTEFMPVKEEEE